MEFNINVANPIDGSSIKVTLYVSTHLITDPEGRQMLNVIAQGTHEL